MKKIASAVVVLLMAGEPRRPEAASAPVGNAQDSIAPVPGEAAAPTIGFFLDDWQPKSFAVPDHEEAPVPAKASVTLTIHADSIITRIPPSEFGQNANTWMSAMVTQPLFLQHVNNLHPHIIRFPAGSGSDVYFWNRLAGNLPSDVPRQLLDRNGKKKFPGYIFGVPMSQQSASLDNYYRMLKETGNEGLLTINYGYARYGTGPSPVSAAAHLAADWVRYDKGRTRYWEIGNENFGDWEAGFRIDTAMNKDGQPAFLTGELYARHFAVFVDSMRAAAAETHAQIFIGAVTMEASPRTWQGNTSRTWNEGMMKGIGGRADFYVVHNYFTPYKVNSDAHSILDSAEKVPGTMMSYVTLALHAYGAALRPIVMDEWNMFAEHSMQQVSNISGVFALIVVGEAMKNKYGLAARWDMVNGWDNGNDHGLFSAGDEPGVSRWSPRPSFYYLYFMQKTIGDRLVGSHVTGDTAVLGYCSRYSSGGTGAVLINTSTTAKIVEIKMGSGSPAGRHYYWYSLEGGQDNGEFSRKVFVNGHGTDAVAGGPPDYASLRARSASTNKGIRVEVPARGAVCLTIDNAGAAIK